jgi:hypothetical protein
MPRQQPFPSDVESFISSCIDSVEQIEVLLYLRDRMGERCTAEDISRDLRSSPHSVALRLQLLVAKGLIHKDEAGYEYAADGGPDDLVRRLAEAYRDRRTAVIERIFSRKKDPMRFFADAFRIREDHGDDG